MKLVNIHILVALFLLTLAGSSLLNAQPLTLEQCVETALRDNIDRLLLSRPQVTLVEVVTSYPIQQGMAEVVAYLMIAAHAPQHRIERAIVDQIIITAPDSDQTRTVNVPRIIFARETQPEADLAR